MLLNNPFFHHKFGFVRLIIEPHCWVSLLNLTSSFSFIVEYNLIVEIRWWTLEVMRTAELLWRNVRSWSGRSSTSLKMSLPELCYGVAGVTILLSLSVFSLMIADALPQTSEAIPLLGQLKATVTCLLFSSLDLLKDIICLNQQLS